MNKKRVVIIGAGYAGVMAALRLSGKDRKQQADTTLVNASDVFVERIRLHQIAANQTIPQHSIRKLLGKRQVNFVQGWIAALDLDRHVVHVDMQSEAREIGYDTLVYALVPESIAYIEGIAKWLGREGSA